MPNYRWYYVPGGVYFFTLVTFHRRQYFDTSERLDHLLSIIRQVQRSKPFDLIAYCLLPDHMHLLVKLPEGDDNFSIRIREIKRLTTLWMRRELRGNVDHIWQDKFWEHTIRDDKDLQVHFDYIHYNPVKHGFVETPMGGSGQVSGIVWICTMIVLKRLIRCNSKNIVMVLENRNTRM